MRNETRTQRTETMTKQTARTIEIACDQHEAAEFAEWLTAEGHNASVGNSTGSYVDGDCTDHDGAANDWLTRQWNDYCNS